MHIALMKRQEGCLSPSSQTLPSVGASTPRSSASFFRPPPRPEQREKFAGMDVQPYGGKPANPIGDIMEFYHRADAIGAHWNTERTKPVPGIARVKGHEPLGTPSLANAFSENFR